MLYKRSVRGKKYFYVKIWNEEKYDYSMRKSIRAIKDELGSKGSRFPHTSKAGAEALIQLWLKDRPQELSTDRLDQYLLDFWKEDSTFIKGKELRGKSYSKEYIHNNESAISSYFVPFLDSIGKREILLSHVSPALLENFLLFMTNKNKVGTRRINAILQAVTVALSEAHRLGLIADNPGAKVSKLQVQKSERQIFKPEEVKEFFRLCSDPRQYGINLLAATTGMRLGECRGLLKDDIKDRYIEVCHNWQDGEGEKTPKWGSSRLIPIPEKTRVCLESLIRKNPFHGNFVFWGTTPDRPIGKRAVGEYFNHTCESIGIKNRVERGLSFHAWRHFYNTMLRGNLPDHVLRRLTGHSSDAMTENYTSITEDQIQAVSELSDMII